MMIKSLGEEANWGIRCALLTLVKRDIILSFFGFLSVSRGLFVKRFEWKFREGLFVLEL